MPVLVSAILRAIPPVSSVATLCTLVVLVFAIVGEQLFEGELHYRCVAEAATDASGAVGRHQRSRTGSALPTFCQPAAEVAHAGACPSGFSCRYFATSAEGHAFHFDSVVDVAMVVVQIMTFDTVRA
jgi:hypothetical protein